MTWFHDVCVVGPVWSLVHCRAQTVSTRCPQLLSVWPVQNWVSAHIRTRLCVPATLQALHAQQTHQHLNWLHPSLCELPPHPGQQHPSPFLNGAIPRMRPHSLTICCSYPNDLELKTFSDFVILCVNGYAVVHYYDGHWVNSFAPRRLKCNFGYLIFRLIFTDWWQTYLLWNFPLVNVAGPYW